MKETEKIEIMHFDQEGYLEDGRNVYEAGKRMTALADRVHEEGYDAVFLMGVGGTWDEFMQLDVSVNLFFTSFAKQARRSRKGGFTGCANVFSPIPVTA